MDKENNIVASVLSERRAPHPGLIVDIVQYNKTTFAYRLYMENLEEFPDIAKVDLYVWIKDCLERVNRPETGVFVGLEVNETWRTNPNTF